MARHGHADVKGVSTFVGPMERLLLITLVLLALVLSLAPKHLSPGALMPHMLVHLLGFGGLTVAAIWLSRRVVLSAIAVFALSVLIELLQLAVPWRQGSMRDITVNLVAVVIGAVVGALVLRIARFRVSGLP